MSRRALTFVLIGMAIICTIAILIVSFIRGNDGGTQSAPSVGTPSIRLDWDMGPVPAGDPAQTTVSLPGSIDLRLYEDAVREQAMRDHEPLSVKQVECLAAGVMPTPGLRFACDVYLVDGTKPTYYVTLTDTKDDFKIDRAK
ncbi:hypothetical protein [Rhodococcus sp. IEGM 1379]|uniref:hypothetical protein n=1 Tax=Rhodococcus sp. IEGM 1379 TaxID=3047086 RepID=UPI0024B66123|nr:hypothetical protein [Rhodococcus sp. IEGM 1379]MDI9918367.1 hypothetical protein [Rhodococcus sp. IEGM 1379]